MEEVFFDIDRFKNSYDSILNGNELDLVAGAISMERQIVEKFSFAFLEELEKENLPQYSLQIVKYGLCRGYLRRYPIFLDTIWKTISAFFSYWIKDEIKSEICDSLVDITADLFIQSNFQKSISDLNLNLKEDSLVQNRSLQIYFRLLIELRNKNNKDEFITKAQKENCSNLIKHYYNLTFNEIFIPIILEKNLQIKTIEIALQWYDEGFLYFLNEDVDVFKMICQLCSRYDQNCEIIINAISSILTKNINDENIVECGNIEVSQSKWETPEYINLAIVLLDTMVDQIFCSKMEKCAAKCCNILTQNNKDNNSLKISEFWSNFWENCNNSLVQQFLLNNYRNYLALLCDLIPAKNPNNPNYLLIILNIGNAIMSICEKNKAVSLNNFRDYCEKLVADDMQKYRISLIVAPFVYKMHPDGEEMMLMTYQKALQAFQMTKQSPYKSAEIASYILEVLRFDTIIFKNPKFATIMYTKAALMIDFTPVRSVAINCLRNLLNEDARDFLRSKDGIALMDSIVAAFPDHIFAASESDVVLMYKIHSQLIDAAEVKRESWIAAIIDSQIERWNALTSPPSEEIAGDTLSMRSLAFELRCVKHLVKRHNVISQFRNTFPIPKLCRVFAQGNDAGFEDAFLKYLKAVTKFAFENGEADVLCEIGANIRLLSRSFRTSMFTFVVEYLLCAEILSQEEAVALFRQSIEFFLCAYEPILLCPHVVLPRRKIESSFVVIIAEVLVFTAQTLDAETMNRLLAVLLFFRDLTEEINLPKALFDIVDQYTPKSALVPAAVRLMVKGIAGHAIDCIPKLFVVRILSAAPKRSAAAIRKELQLQTSVDVICNKIKETFTEDVLENDDLSCEKLCDLMRELYSVYD